VPQPTVKNPLGDQSLLSKTSTNVHTTEQ